MFDDQALTVTKVLAMSTRRKNDFLTVCVYALIMDTFNFDLACLRYKSIAHMYSVPIIYNIYLCNNYLTLREERKLDQKFSK
jgi:hypothetical protein